MAFSENITFIIITVIVAAAAAGGDDERKKEKEKELCEIFVLNREVFCRSAKTFMYCCAGATDSPTKKEHDWRSPAVGLCRTSIKNPGSYGQGTGVPAKLLNLFLSGSLFFTRIFFY